jgi:hypothetical protein
MSQDQEAWAYGAAYVDVNMMDAHDGSRGASVGSLVLKVPFLTATHDGRDFPLRLERRTLMVMS